MFGSRMELIAAVKVDHDIVAGRIIANEVLCLSLSTEIPAFSKRRMHAGILSQRGRLNSPMSRRFFGSFIMICPPGGEETKRPSVR